LTGQTPEKAMAIDGTALTAELETFLMEPLTERSFADHVHKWLESEAEYAEPLGLAAQYAVWATLSPEGRSKHRSGVLFKTPHKLDPYHLVPAEHLGNNGLVQLQFGPQH